jgi:hypothetical protein
MGRHPGINDYVEDKTGVGRLAQQVTCKAHDSPLLVQQHDRDLEHPQLAARDHRYT